MSTDKMREEFEAAAEAEGLFDLSRVFGNEAERVGLDDGDYYHLNARSAWHWWQASRAALVVELPAATLVPFGTLPTPAQVMELARKSIEAAGVRVKA